MTDLDLTPEITEALESGAWMIINTSGGKDSGAMFSALMRKRETLGWQGRVVAIHADVEGFEWPQSEGVARRAAEDFYTEFVVVRAKKDLLTRVEEKYERRPDAPPWPSSAARYCTSDFKRSPINVWMRNNIPDGKTAISFIGLRAEESPARAKKPLSRIRTQASAPTKGRIVYDSHPILHWSEEDVWSEIGYSMDELAAIQDQVAGWKAENGSQGIYTYINNLGFKAHPVYALGNSRCSCAICIFADDQDFLNGAEFAPDIFRRIVALEARTGYTYFHKKSIEDRLEGLL